METADKILNFAYENWETLTLPVVLWIIERITRAVPTKKNISILDNAYKFLAFFVGRNKRIADHKDVVNGDPNKNIVVVDRDKHLL